MGLTKTDLFTVEQNQIAVKARVLGHPARIAILEYLLNANACINSDLVNELGLAQATISQHLKELKNIGLIQGTIDGTSMNYCINRKAWEEMQNDFIAFFNQLKSCSSDNCC